ncbi:hypothetical protein BJV82DRAFT_54720 [Fennellomyces sp. T-0311]|nr:hypothetical protein BJV82DRAFT_54720 [Fennellomyces sp. T-0311]
MIFLKASKKGSWQLTQEAKDEFERKFRALEDSKKWKLRDGVYVEDIMYKFGTKCTHEHPVHSFILNVDDKCWEEESDFTPEDISAIRTFGNYAFRPISDNLNALFAAYKGHPQVDALGFLIEKTNMLGPYDPRTHPDEYKVHHALQQFVGYYVDDVFAGVESWSEQDFVTHVWSVFDRFFHPLGVMTSRDRTCEATSQRVNSDRAVTGSSEIKDKKRSIRPDLVLLKDGLQYGCSELGKTLGLYLTKRKSSRPYCIVRKP